MKQFRIVVEGQYLDFELTNATLGDAIVNRAVYEDMIRWKTAELIVAVAQEAWKRKEKTLPILFAYEQLISADKTANTFVRTS